MAELVRACDAMEPRKSADVAPTKVDTTPRPSSPPSGPMTRARVKALHDNVNSILSTVYLDTTLDGLLLHSNVLHVIRYEFGEVAIGNTQGPSEQQGTSLRERRDEKDRGEEELRPVALALVLALLPPPAHAYWKLAILLLVPSPVASTVPPAASRGPEDLNRSFLHQ
jgi:hypothetical protein